MSKPTTLQQQFEDAGISLKADDNEYHPMLEIVDIMMGYKPKLNGLVKLWPPGFRTFHVLFKNSANMPYAMLGSEPFIRELFIAMYAASRETGCEYCTATAVGVALRRGALPSRITCTAQTPADAALFSMCKSLAKARADITVDKISAMRAHFSEAQVEYIALSVGLMGFMNLLTSVTGLKLEKAPLDETANVLGSTGWTPGEKAPDDFKMPEQTGPVNDIPQREKLSTFLRMAKYGPHAMYVETKWVAGVPSKWPSAGRYLQNRTGYNFPILSKITQHPALLAYATIFRDNFDADLSEIGLIAKSLCGLVYATFTADEFLAEEARSLATITARREGLPIDELTFTEIEKIAREPPPTTSEEVAALFERLNALAGVTSRRASAAIILSRACSARPMVLAPIIITDVTSQLSPGEIVETIIWLGLQQCFHRVLRFYDVNNAVKTALKRRNQEMETEPSSHSDSSEPKAEVKLRRKGLFAMFFGKRSNGGKTAKSS